MNVELRRMHQEEFDLYFDQAITTYTEKLIKSGRFMDTEKAQAFAQWEYHDIFKQGLDTPDTDVYHIHTEDKPIGVIWLLREGDIGFIGDFFIEKAYRHRGYGKAALQLLEISAQQAGMTHLRLGVFKHNQIARNLYEQLSYQGIKFRHADITMEKQINKNADKKAM